MSYEQPVKPMKASPVEDFSTLPYPLCVTPKYDGIRCLIHDGVALSNTLKPIPNQFVQQWAKDNASLLNGADGELIVGPHDKGVFKRTMSGIMSKGGEPDFTFYAFDCWDFPDSSYVSRLNILSQTLGTGYKPARTTVVHPHYAHTMQDLAEIEAMFLAEGYEGVMARKPEGRYKYGRSSVKECLLLKVKRFVDDEATVIGYGEMQHNNNEAKTDELGRTKRSSHATGKSAAGVLGYLIVTSPTFGEFEVGGGFTAEERAELWANRKDLLGSIITFKYFPIGTHDKPRFPVFKGFRHPLDITPTETHHTWTQPKPAESQQLTASIPHRTTKLSPPPQTIKESALAGELSVLNPYSAIDPQPDSKQLEAIWAQLRESGYVVECIYEVFTNTKSSPQSLSAGSYDEPTIPRRSTQ